MLHVTCRHRIRAPVGADDQPPVVVDTGGRRGDHGAVGPVDVDEATDGAAGLAIGEVDPLRPVAAVGEVAWRARSRVRTAAASSPPDRT